MTTTTARRTAWRFLRLPLIGLAGGSIANAAMHLGFTSIGVSLFAVTVIYIVLSPAKR